MKKNYELLCFAMRRWKKLIRAMRLTISLLLFSLLSVTAASTYSQSVRFDLKMQDVSLIDVFRKIEETSEFGFFFKNEEIDKDQQVSIDVRNASIEETLDRILRGNYDYRILNKNIIVTRSVSNNLEQIMKTISGKVTDENGEPLPGVTVLIKGTTNGTVTNIDGIYTISNVPENTTLQFSFVGMKSQEIVVGNERNIDIVLVTDAIGLEEVVAVGYGTVKKSDLTGAVMRVKGESFQNQSSTQVLDMLAGSVAGLNISQSSTAGGGSSLEVRGPTSLTAGTDPLVVLDGAIFNGSINDINPSDIETVDVLKDASSAAVYGAKAASGVVIITTKKGKTGKPTINFTSKIGLTGITNDSFGPRTGEEYEDFRRDYFRTLGVVGREDWYWNNPNNLPDGLSVEQWRNANNNPNADNTLEYLNRLNFFDTEIEQYLAGNTISWYDEVIQTGLNQDYDLSIGGGAKDYNYYWSIGYTDNEGVIKGDEFSIIRSRLNADYKIAEWLNVGLNSQFSAKDKSSVPASLAVESVSPYSKIFDEDGSMRWYPHDYGIATNPLLNHYYQQRDNKTVSFFASMFAQVSLPFGIEYKLSYQPRYSFTRNYNFWGSETLMGGAYHVGGFSTRHDVTQFEWMVDNLLTWKKEIGVHNFDVTLLYNAEQIKTFSSLGSSETFEPNEVLGYNALQFGLNPIITNDDTQAGGDALMGRLNYSLKDKYYLTLSVRRDGYSAFGQENPRATFPATSLAWKISEEDFFKSEIINRLKIRTSWGINGNRDIGIYSALAKIGKTMYYDGSNVQMGLYNNTLANRSLQWERTEAFNVGLDMGLFNNRIDLSAEVYFMNTTNLLMNRQLPQITGYNSITANLGELGNKGFEMTLNTVNISNPNFTWKSSLVFSFNRNEIKELFGDVDENGVPLPDYTNHWFPGEAIDVVWDYDVLGVWQLDEEEEAAKYNMKPGDYKGEDVDGDYSYDALIDKQFIGHDKPRFRFGFRNDFTFLKNFTVSAFIRADLGHIGYFPYATHESSTYDRRSYWNIPYWTPTNGNNEYARLSEVHGAYGGGLRIFKPRSFVRLQDLSLSFNIPKNLTRKMKIDGARVFASGRNLLTFTNWSGWDPESGNSPMPKNVTLGLSLTF